MRKRIVINIDCDMSDLEALQKVLNVVHAGLKSKNRWGEQYTWVSTWLYGNFRTYVYACQRKGTKTQKRTDVFYIGKEQDNLSKEKAE